MTYEEIVCDANNLYSAYLASMRGSRWKERNQKFAMNYLRHIFQIQSELQNRTLVNSPVEEFILSERGRARSITSIPIKDRIIRHVLCDEILLPEVRKRVIYDNCASIKGRGISLQRKRFEVHLHKYYRQYGNDGWILLGDFSKFYDNIPHDRAKADILKLFENDNFLAWLMDLIFDGFKIDVSYLSDDEYACCMDTVFNKNEYRKIDKKLLTGEKFMEKSINIGDQLSQVIGIYYPHPIDNYIKTVRAQKFYGRYMDDWYIINPDKEELEDLLEHIREIAKKLGIHINDRKTRIVKLNSIYCFLQVKYSLRSDGMIIKRIKPKRITRMRRKLKKLSIKVTAGKLPYEQSEEMFRSWMGSFYKLMSKKQRSNLIELYEALFHKKITIVNKKMIFKDINDQTGGMKNMKPNGKQVALAAISTVQTGYTYDEMDCQAFVEHSVKQAGGDMDYSGSNDMARHMAWLGTIENAKADGKLIPGALLFIHEDNESNLPESYQGDGFGDFSHVGVYLGDNTFSDVDKNGDFRTCDAAHSSSTMGRAAGSTLKNGWTHVGLAKEIDYGEEIIEGVQPGHTEDESEEETADLTGSLTAGTAPAKQYAVVHSENGKPVKLRKSASNGESVYWKVNNGARVLVEREVDGWMLIRAICTDGRTRRAYMMSKFLKMEV